MVEVFLIYIESVEKNNKGYLSKQTRKQDGGIRVEFVSSITDGNSKTDIDKVVAYFTRGSAMKTKDLIVSEIANFHPDATVKAEVKSVQVTLADSRAMNNSSWTYK